MYLAHQRLTSPRLKTWNYTDVGYYFVTICAKYRLPFFGSIEQDVMIINATGEIVSTTWKNISRSSSFVELDEWIVMPDHIHGIICLREGAEKPLSDIIGAFKTVTSKQIHQFCPEFLWQRSFYDRIIRNDQELDRIRLYIKNNPVNYQIKHEPAGEQVVM